MRKVVRSAEKIPSFETTFAEVMKLVMLVVVAVGKAIVFQANSVTNAPVVSLIGAASTRACDVVPEAVGAVVS